MASDHEVDLLLFDNQGDGIHACLNGLYRRAKTSALLTTFLQDSICLIQKASSGPRTSDESPSVKAALSAKTFLQLADDSRLPRAATAAVLTCVSQLGSFLIWLEETPLSTRRLPVAAVCGVGFGSLAATAASAVTNVVDLLQIAPELILVALRLGLAISHRGRSVEEGAGSCSVLVSCISAKRLSRIVDDCNRNNSSPRYRCIYISVIAEDGCEVSGPSSSIDHFMTHDAEELAGFKLQRVPRTGLIHASHLQPLDLDSIIGTSELWDKSCSSTSPVVLLNNLKANDNLRSLLRHRLTQITQQPLDYVGIVSEVRQLCKENPINLVPFGQSKLVTDLQVTSAPRITQSPPLDVPSKPEDESSGDIAIVGMSGRFPGADSPNELWDLLLKGIDTHKEIPKDRFDVQTHWDPSGQRRNTTLTPYGCFIEHPDLFDRTLFKMSAREVAQTDPIHRLMLMTAYEALETAGYSAEDVPNATIGTYYGQSSDDWREVNAGQNIDIFHITGGNRAFGPGRINYFFGWEGPSMNIDAACSASALSIQLACSALKSRECDTALAGGANILTASDIFAGLSRGGFLSPTGSCKTWDAAADGYCRADAVGSLVLKRAEDAIQGRDHILAIVKSVATNHSAKAISITHPHSDTQQALFKEVLRQGLTSPEEVDYVEMHGTGTQAGDIAESASIAAVFSGPRKTPLHVGTVKPNVGHGEAASGVTSIIKAIKMMQEGTIPRHIGIKGDINPNLGFNKVEGIRIPLDNTPFANTDGARKKILVNNFNATGGNTSLLLEEAPVPIPKKGSDERGYQVVVLSAATQSSLSEAVERMLEYLNSNSDTNIQNLAYTTTARRIHHSRRIAFAVQNTGQLAREIRCKPMQESPRKPPAIVWLFTGQSSMQTKAAQALLYTSASFMRRIRTISAVCENFGWPGVLEAIEKSDERIAFERPGLSQMTLVALEIALVDQWRSWGLQPTIVIGHSLGEYAALYAAGVLTMLDTLYLVGARAKLLQSHILKGEGCMMFVKRSAEQVQKSLDYCAPLTCEIAAINGPSATVVSGHFADLRRFEQIVKADDPSVRCVHLDIPYAFHSRQMEPMLEEFEKASTGVRFEKPSVPVVSTLSGLVVEGEAVFNASYFSQQMRHPVQYSKALKACQSYLDDESALWFEIGPSTVCIPMVRSTLRAPTDRLLASLDPQEPVWKTICCSLAKVFQAGIDVKWRALHQEYEPALSLLQLPSYPFDLKSYWLQYEGDWCITKNQGSPSKETVDDHALLSTTVHRLEEETSTDHGTKFTFITDFAEPTLNKMAQGHLVNGSSLCPSSIHADIAMTVAKYCWQRLQPSEGLPAIDVTNMEVFKPLIIHADGTSQPIKIIADFDRKAQQIYLSIESTDMSNVLQHVTCTTIYNDSADWTTTWNTMAYLYQSRIDYLLEAASQGKAHRILKGMVYKLFSSFVDYHESFQMIEEVTLDSQTREASALVRLQQPHGDYFMDPHWIDGLAHLSGFILNGSDQAPSDTVYISHGWKSMRFAAPLVVGHVYRTHIRMQPAGNRGVFSGDLHVFQDKEIVGVISGLKFQAIKKAILATLLPGGNKETVGPNVTPLQLHQDDNHSDSAPGSGDSSSTSSVVVRTPNTPTMHSDPGALSDTFRAILAKEIGISEDEIEPKADLADLGVDSLLSVAVISAFAAQTSIQLSLGFFNNYPTFAHVGNYLETLGIPESPTSDTPDHQERQQSPQSPAPIVAAETAQCTSVHLQHIPNPDAPILFLLPDGSGSAGAYANVSTLAADIDVIALDSPYKSHPEDFTISVSEIASKYTSSIISHILPAPDPSLASNDRRSQSITKKIFLGGWSIGGAYAYEVAFQLLSRGVSVSGLVIIDCINPSLMSPLPIDTVDLLETAGVFDDMKTRERTRGAGVRGSVHEKVQEHFRNSIRAMKTYSPKPLSEAITTGESGGKATLAPPRCHAIWARHGIFELISEEKMANVRKQFKQQMFTFSDMQKWLLVSKENDYGAHGWNELIDDGDGKVLVENHVVDGHHMSIMREPKVKGLHDAIDRAMNTMLNLES